MRHDELLALVTARFPEAKREEGSEAVLVPKERLLELARFLKNEPLNFDDLHCVTAIDRKEIVEVVYIFYSNTHPHELTVKVKLAPDSLIVESLAPLWKSADWLERETYDLFGVCFLNHPNPKRILNPDDWTGHPLRKNFSHPNLIQKPKL